MIADNFSLAHQFAQGKQVREFLVGTEYFSGRFADQLGGGDAYYFFGPGVDCFDEPVAVDSYNRSGGPGRVIFSRDAHGVSLFCLEVG
jgi:hypothetical protein